MLQQTTVPHATAYFLDFLGRWPTVGRWPPRADDEVMAAWAGLGYYARARNLLACARAVAGEHGGVFPARRGRPEGAAGRRRLHGRGHRRDRLRPPANVVDGNVERVMARLYAVETPLPAAKPELIALAGALADAERARATGRRR